MLALSFDAGATIDEFIVNDAVVSGELLPSH